jgi:hypothetical protein
MAAADMAAVATGVAAADMAAADMAAAATGKAHHLLIGG